MAANYRFTMPQCVECRTTQGPFHERVVYSLHGPTTCGHARTTPILYCEPCWNNGVRTVLEQHAAVNEMLLKNSH